MDGQQCAGPQHAFRITDDRHAETVGGEHDAHDGVAVVKRGIGYGDDRIHPSGERRQVVDDACRFEIDRMHQRQAEVLRFAPCGIEAGIVVVRRQNAEALQLRHARLGYRQMGGERLVDEEGRCAQAGVEGDDRGVGRFGQQGAEQAGVRTVGRRGAVGLAAGRHHQCSCRATQRLSAVQRDASQWEAALGQGLVEGLEHGREHRRVVGGNEQHFARRGRGVRTRAAEHRQQQREQYAFQNASIHVSVRLPFRKALDPKAGEPTPDQNSMPALK
jgi:hypothetical protein